MQMTYHITCKCGHDFPIPAQFLSTDEDERASLIKALEGLPCPDCIEAAIDQLHALREHLLKSGAVPPDITEEGWKSLARDARRDILRENIIPPPPPRSPDISDEIMRYPICPNIPPDLPETLPKDLHQPLECPDKSPYIWDGPGALGIADEIQKLSELLPQLDVAENWNRHFPDGTEVIVNPTDAEKVSDPCTHRTTSPARLLAGKAVVEVSGLGPIDLDRLVPFGG